MNREPKKWKRKISCTNNNRNGCLLYYEVLWFVNASASFWIVFSFCCFALLVYVITSFHRKAITILLIHACLCMRVSVCVSETNLNWIHLCVGIGEPAWSCSPPKQQWPTKRRRTLFPSMPLTPEHRYWEYFTRLSLWFPLHIIPSIPSVIDRMQP